MGSALCPECCLPAPFHLWAAMQQLSLTSPQLLALQNGLWDSNFCLGIFKKHLVFQSTSLQLLLSLLTQRPFDLVALLQPLVLPENASGLL